MKRNLNNSFKKGKSYNEEELIDIFDSPDEEVVLFDDDEVILFDEDNKPKKTHMSKTKKRALRGIAVVTVGLVSGATIYSVRASNTNLVRVTKNSSQVFINTLSDSDLQKALDRYAYAADIATDYGTDSKEYKNWVKRYKNLQAEQKKRESQKKTTSVKKSSAESRRVSYANYTTEIRKSLEALDKKIQEANSKLKSETGSRRSNLTELIRGYEYERQAIISNEKALKKAQKGGDKKAEEKYSGYLRQNNSDVSNSTTVEEAEANNYEAREVLEVNAREDAKYDLHGMQAAEVKEAKKTQSNYNGGTSQNITTEEKKEWVDDHRRDGTEPRIFLSDDEVTKSLFSSIEKNINNSVGKEILTYSSDGVIAFSHKKYAELEDADKTKFLETAIMRIKESRLPSRVKTSASNFVAERDKLRGTKILALYSDTTEEAAEGYARLRFLFPFIRAFFGLMVVLTTAFGVITMVLDLSYMTLGMARVFFDGLGDENGPKFISKEAYEAIKTAEQANSPNRAYLFTYLKSRFKILFLTAMCLGILLSGNLYNIIAFILQIFEIITRP